MKNKKKQFLPESPIKILKLPRKGVLVVYKIQLFYIKLIRMVNSLISYAFCI